MTALERLLAFSRGVRRSPFCATHDQWQGELLGTLMLDEFASYPSAPLTWLGGRGESPPACVFHVDPIRMTISADGLSLEAMPPWRAEQLEVLVGNVRTHLKEGMTNVTVLGQSAFLTVSGSADVDTVSVQQAERLSLNDALPRGPDAAGIRRLMTEMQMLMHDLYSEGSAANGVWLWGNGALKVRQPRNFPALWTNDAYARGIYALHGALSSCTTVPSSFEATSDLPAHSMFVVRGLSCEALEARWFAPLLSALERGRLECIDVHLDGFGGQARRSAWRRLFARSYPLAEVLQ